MLIERTTTGIDYPISQLQAYLHTKLVGLGWLENGYYAYPRCYRNNTKDGYIPEVFDQVKNNYTQLYVNDKITALSFFGIGDDIEIDSAIQNTADVHLIYIVDLSKLQPGNPREDEKVRLQVFKLVTRAAWGFELTDQVLGWDNVFSEYEGFLKDQERFRDMHPFHVFRFNFKLRYNPIKC